MAEIDIYSGREAQGRAPGVYIQEVKPSPEAGLVTGVPLFIGFARISAQVPDEDRNGPPRLLRVTRWEQFEHSIDAVHGSFLSYAVRGFFENGGRRCVVLPLEGAGDQGSETLTRALKNLFRKDYFQKDHQGIRGILDDIDDTDLVCVPDIMMDDIRRSEETVLDLQQEVLEYCQDRGERFAILDVLPGAAADSEGTTEEAIHHWQELSPPEGALYFPWVRVKTLDGSGEQWVPPCGHVAGIYARTDARAGFHKAPANEIVEGILDLQTHITNELQSRLNDAGVNCLRSFVRRGIRVWGARTLSGHRQWRYVNVRRIFLTLFRWIKHNMNDLVFEPNNPQLWDRVRDRLGGYCYELFMRGALKGQDPAEAFFIKCDAENNPLEVRETGQVICEIGLAPLTPAEFILIRITQSAAETTAVVSPGM